ncbi:MAG: L-rhamnose mutarotase [Chloroflexi bacterium OHK40]
MQRAAFLLKVRPELVAEYRARHAAVWPEMLEALRRHGWHNYSLFMRDDGLLFGYVECAESLEASLAGMAGEEVNERWQQAMAPFFEGIGGKPADQGLLRLEEVFHLD